MAKGGLNVVEPGSLAEIPVFHGLPQETLAWLGAHVQTQKFDTGEAIFHQDEPGTGLYIVRCGRVQILMQWDATDTRGQVVLATLGPGDIIGELASLDGGPHATTVIALEPVQCWFLPRHNLETLLDQSPHFSRTLLRLLAQRVRQSDARVAQEARDPLTGLANRGALAGFFQRQMSAIRREGGKVALVLADMDNLKRINDTGGHEAGDRALIALAQAMQENIRGTDLAVRYGGDEFVLVLPGADVTVAERVIERVRAHLAKKGNPGVRFSYGIAAAECPANTIPPGLQELLARADSALYQAKARLVRHES